MKRVWREGERWVRASEGKRNAQMYKVHSLVKGWVAQLAANMPREPGQRESIPPPGGFTASPGSIDGFISLICLLSSLPRLCLCRCLSPALSSYNPSQLRLLPQLLLVLPPPPGPPIRCPALASLLSPFSTEHWICILMASVWARSPICIKHLKDKKENKLKVINI